MAFLLKIYDECSFLNPLPCDMGGKSVVEIGIPTRGNPSITTLVDSISLSAEARPAKTSQGFAVVMPTDSPALAGGSLSHLAADAA